ncbi:MAG: hypothetical protein V1494_02230 [Candidatus Diapherotrites archaeon]
MKTALCENDLKKDSLCSSCRQRLDDGAMTLKDVEVSRALYRLSKKFFFLNVEFNKALDLDELLVLVCQGNIGSLIGKKGRIVAVLSKEFGKKVRVIEKAKDEKKMLQDLLGSVRVIGVNKVFKPEGHELKVLIEKKDMDKMPLKAEDLEKSINSLLESKARVEFV